MKGIAEDIISGSVDEITNVIQWLPGSNALVQLHQSHKGKED